MIPTGSATAYHYPTGPGPSISVVNGALHITASTTGMASNIQYWGVVITINGNAAGTDCVDASAYIGIQFDIAGTIAGTGCSAQYATQDSPHADRTADPRGAGPPGSYQPQAALNATASVQTIRMPFVGAGAPTAGSPAIPLDKARLLGVLWQFATAAGTINNCAVDVTIDNLKFY